MGNAATREELANAKEENERYQQVIRNLELDAHNATTRHNQMRQEHTQHLQHADQQRLAHDRQLRDALKRAEVAEQLQRADALLVKRVTSALLKKHSASELAAALPPPSANNDGGALGSSAAAADILAAASAEDEMRAGLARIKRLEAQADELRREREVEERRELSAALWQAQLCDASVSVRSSRFAVMGGVRMPREETDYGAGRAQGLLASVGALRSFRDAAQPHRSVSVGGALHWDAEQSVVSALRAGVCLTPAPRQSWVASVDHAGVLEGGARFEHEGVSVRLSASVDVNQKRPPTAAVEVSYDV